MDAQGNASLLALRNAVADAAIQWGLNPEAVRGLIRPESLFTGAFTPWSTNPNLAQVKIRQVASTTNIPSQSK